MKQRKIYLAAPFFTDEERCNVQFVAEKLRSFGHEVYVPMEHFIEDGDTMPNDKWGARVFEEDRTAIDECDEVHALCYGFTDDAGTAWEIGYAYAKGKVVIPHFLNNDVDYSLMVVNGSSLLSCDKAKVEQR